MEKSKEQLDFCLEFQDLAFRSWGSIPVQTIAKGLLRIAAANQRIAVKLINGEGDRPSLERKEAAIDQRIKKLLGYKKFKWETDESGLLIQFTFLPSGLSIWIPT